MAIDFTKYFTKVGRGVYAGDTAILSNARTTVPTAIENFIKTFDTEPEPIQAATNQVHDLLRSYQQTGSSLTSSIIGTPLQNLTRQVVADDNPTPNGSDLEAITEVIRQLVNAGQTIDAPSVGTSETPNGSNVGNGEANVMITDIDGFDQIYCLPEKITLTCIATNRSGQATFQLRSFDQVGNRFDVAWPGGSGLNQNIISNVAGTGGNVVSNGGFETENSSDSNIPSGWTAQTKTAGFMSLTAVEQHDIVIAGTPTAGYYQLVFTAHDGTKQTTREIPFNATSAAVQAALRSLSGLGAVTVETAAGTSPNFTHRVTYNGIKKPGAVIAANITNLTAGTITPAIFTAGSTKAVRGARAFEWTGDGAALHTMHYDLPLNLATQYSFSVMMSRTAAVSAGVILFEIVDGIDGNVLTDLSGKVNALTIDATTLGNTMGLIHSDFRVPRDVPSKKAYLRLRTSTAIANTGVVTFDELQIRATPELYTGGPTITLYSGTTDWQIGDEIEVQINNDRAGKMNDWLDRIYQLRENRLRFPVQPAPSTYPDATYVV